MQLEKRDIDGENKERLKGGTEPKGRLSLTDK